MLLAAIPPPPGDRIVLGPLDIRFYGLAIAVGALAAVWLARRRYAAVGGDPELADRTAVVAAIFALIGARIGFVLPRLDQFAEQPLRAIAIWEGGMTFFGALAGGLAAAIWYVSRQGVDLGALLDAAAPAIPLAQAIGRLGNYFNQELYGRPTDLPWALEVEPAHRVSGFEAYETFHPTFLYEMVWNLGLAAALIAVGRRFSLRRGSLFLLYLIGYGVGRFWIELLRIDVPDRIFGLSRNNWNALAIIVLGLGLLWWRQRHRPGAQAASGDAPG